LSVISCTVSDYTYFLLAIALSVIPCTVSDYTFFS
jgi:hypothetical protein